MKRTCLRINTNTNENSKHGVPCPPAGRHPTLIKKLFTDEKETFQLRKPYKIWYYNKQKLLKSKCYYIFTNNYDLKHEKN